MATNTKKKSSYKKNSTTTTKKKIVTKCTNTQKKVSPTTKKVCQPVKKTVKQEAKEVKTNYNNNVTLKKVDPKTKETKMTKFIKVRKDDMKKFKDRFKKGTWKDRLLIILMLVLIGLVVLFILFCAYVVISAPSITNDRLYKTNSTVIYDANGNEIARLGTENREKVTFDELPEVLIDAIVATEDSRFFQHSGVDIARFSKAVVGQLLGRSDAGGASTLTMQVSKNAATSNESHGIKGVIRKFQDVYLSVFVFEKKYTKEQIMEFYVNIPNLGAGAYGVQQASQVYFGKDVSDLTLSEAAIIAGLFQAPSTYNPYNNPDLCAKRRNTVLKLMYRHGYITEEEMNAANNIDVTSLLVGKGDLINQNQGFIDTVVQEVRDRTGTDPYNVSMEIYSTMVPEKQDVINKIYSGETYKWKNDYVQAAGAVIDNKTGAIIAIMAGRNKTSEMSFNFATDGRRHPGSTAKPVIDYGPAIEYLGWGSGNTIVDDEMTYTGGHSIKNFDNKFKEVETVKKALGESRNIPALETFQLTTNEQKLKFATSLGWRPETDITGENLKAENPSDIKGTLLESDSIGGFNGVTPLEAAAAYATFARGGIYIEPYSFTKIVYTESGDTYEVQPEQHRAMSEETAYIINMILKWAVQSGNVVAGSVSGTDICGKTGTSTLEDSTIKKYKLKNSPINDAWENTYSPNYTISLWYGYENVNSEHYLTNTEGNVEKRKIVKLLDNGIFEKNSRFTQPKGVVTATIELGTDPLQLASAYTPDDLKSVEYFKKGTAPSTVSERFTKLKAVNRVAYTSTDSTVTLKWEAVATPNFVNYEYLKNYFTESKAYYRWADKYYQQRVDWNTANLGNFGYRIYQKVGDDYVDLGFTTNTSFTTPLTSEGAQFLVKTSYEKFIANMSDPVIVTVAPNSQSTDPIEDKPAQEEKYTIQVDYRGPSCSTAMNWNNLGGTDKDKIKVTKIVNSANVDVTNESTINCTIFDENDNVITGTLENGKSYEANCHINFSGKNYTKKIVISKTC